jgi:FkbM family methyltransferase
MVVAQPDGGERRAREWLRAKLCAFAPGPRRTALRPLTRKVTRHGNAAAATSGQAPFENPFVVEDLQIFDDETLRDALAHDPGALGPEALGRALRSAPGVLAERVGACLPERERERYLAEAQRAAPVDPAARRRLLDGMFWELTYWKTPELYEALTEGERLHPGIFRRLAPELRGRIVLDAGAGSGRATVACLRAGAARVYAVEPSPGLRRLLDRKLAAEGAAARARVTALAGHFDALPLADASVDVALLCSAFTVESNEGAEAGLAELRRVTRRSGKIVLIWPRPEDYAWLAAHGFTYVPLRVLEGMGVRYRSRQVALAVARRFYAHNRAVLWYLLRHRDPAVPYAVLGDNPPHDYCWLTVE